MLVAPEDQARQTSVGEKEGQTGPEMKLNRWIDDPGSLSATGRKAAAAANANTCV